MIKCSAISGQLSAVSYQRSAISRGLWPRYANSYQLSVRIEKRAAYS
ncbi:MAG: hypothetical protein F6J98_26755 [Moorea sp. SIO4G2]|nr:hypothetical protein [Moorena bouillonii]NEO63832.1 hypothetical protein [Moorena sp. SIO4G2]